MCWCLGERIALKNMLKFIILGVMLIEIIESQKSPCPKIFKYDPNRPNVNDRWFGRLTLMSDQNLVDGVFVIFTFDKPVVQLGTQFGQKIVRITPMEFLVENIGYTLMAKMPITMKFFVKYAEHDVPPNLVGVKINSRTVCPEDMSPSSTETPEDLVSITTEADVEDHKEFNNTSEDKITQLQAMSTLYLPHEILELPDIPCGKVAEKPIGLIAFGEDTTPGQWPWHAALYNKLDSQLRYTCGGSLITKRHILTAAHCVNKARSNNSIDPNIVTVFLGKYNLSKFGASVQERKVKKINIHPKFTHNILFNDIAILTLNEPVKFTDFVRPVCLWDDYYALDIVHDRKGTVVGWGFDENKQLSNTLKQVEMPVVAHENCILSNSEFFSKVMNEYNFCAGFRNGSSACNGDSGGGMVFPKLGTQGENLIWQIRGIVSIGVALQGQHICDNHQFVVFTDVAKYLPWINRVIEG